jgi:endonuclease III
MSNHGAIKERLIQFWQSQHNEKLLPALTPEAEELISKDHFAYLLAACLDRGMKAEIVWTFPYWLKQLLGHLDPRLISIMSLNDIRAALLAMTYKPRYMRDAPRTVQEVASMVSQKFGGDAAKLWCGRTARAVQDDLMNIYGVGKGIAAMTVILLHRMKWANFPDLHTIPVKPDVHVQRVMYRTGLADQMGEEAATCAAHKLNPQFPGELDSPVWIIGRQWCKSTPAMQDCPSCPLTDLCPKIGLEARA